MFDVGSGVGVLELLLVVLECQQLVKRKRKLSKCYHTSDDWK